MSSKVMGRLISDDEDSEEEDVIIIEDDDEETTGAPEVSGKLAAQPIMERSVNVRICDGEYEWWNKLLAPVPEEQQCRINDCKVAPAGHKKHARRPRNYSIFELKIKIQYLVHFENICYGKGIKVYEEMHTAGFMKHRTVQSLNNNFKRILLRDIRQFQLPQDIEAQFVELIP